MESAYYYIRFGCFVTALSVGMVCHEDSSLAAEQELSLANPLAFHLVQTEQNLAAVPNATRPALPADTHAPSMPGVEDSPLRIPTSLVPLKSNTHAPETCPLDKQVECTLKLPAGMELPAPASFANDSSPPARAVSDTAPQFDVADKLQVVFESPSWPEVVPSTGWTADGKETCPEKTPVVRLAARHSAAVQPLHVPDELVYADAVLDRTAPDVSAIAEANPRTDRLVVEADAGNTPSFKPVPPMMAGANQGRTNGERAVEMEVISHSPAFANADDGQGDRVAMAHHGPAAYSSNCYPSPACTTLGPYSPCPVNGFHCVGCGKCRGIQTRLTWKQAGPIPWEAFGHGEYIGPARLAAVPEYRLRVDDVLDFVYRLTRDVTSSPYRLEVADQILIESLTSPSEDKEVQIQSDGTISLRNLGQVPAAGRTIGELRDHLNEAYSEFITDPQITVTPIVTNTKLTEMIAAVDNRFGQGGQQRPATVTPEGTVQLPAIGSVPAQGLTLEELQREIHARYDQVVQGLEVTPILQQRAPRYVFVVGEVASPGRYTLEGPTTVMQVLALAGSWNVGADLRHVVVFRRDENWNLMATRLDIRAPLYGRSPCPADEIWIRDSDIVVVPKHPILCADDAIELIFTRGVYAVFPVSFGYQLQNFTVVP